MTPPLNRVEITGKPPAISVLVDGKMLACDSAVLEVDAESLPRLTVRLPVCDGLVVTLDGTIGRFTDDTRAALVSMGWTPPAESEPAATPEFSEVQRPREPDLCRRCDVFIGYGGAGVVMVPEEHADDPDWLGSHCWVCGKSREEIASGSR